MVKPTRFIDHEEFRDLMKQEGSKHEGTQIQIPLYRLDSVHFQPPLLGEEWKGEVINVVNILLLNVAEACLYKDPSGAGFIILPGHSSDDFNYEYFNDFHPQKNPWYFRLVPAYWRARDWKSYELADARVWYNHELGGGTAEEVTYDKV